MLYIVIGIVIGFIFAKTMCGHHEHQQGILKSLIFHYKKNQIHLHHWLMGLMIIVTLPLFKLMHDHLWKIIDYLILGFAIGMFLQGLTYKDWKEVIIHEN